MNFHRITPPVHRCQGTGVPVLKWCTRPIPHLTTVPKWCVRNQEPGTGDGRCGGEGCGAPLSPLRSVTGTRPQAAPGGSYGRILSPGGVATPTPTPPGTGGVWVGAKGVKFHRSPTPLGGKNPGGVGVGVRGWGVPHPLGTVTLGTPLGTVTLVPLVGGNPGVPGVQGTGYRGRWVGVGLYVKQGTGGWVPGGLYGVGWGNRGRGWGGVVTTLTTPTPGYQGVPGGWLWWGGGVLYQG